MKLALGLVALVSFADLLAPFQVPGSREAEQGLRHYREGEFEAAADQWRQALEASSDPRLEYNLGAATYREEHFPEAVAAYQQAALSPEVPEASSAYDMGNALYRSGDLEGALTAYRAALRIDPDDQDARYNYELTLRQLESGEPPPEDQQPPPQDESSEPSEDQDRNEASEPDSSQAPSQNPGEQPQEQQPPDDQENPPDQAQPEEAGEEQNPQTAAGSPEEERMLSPEEAMRLLNAVTPEERELLQARLKASRRKKVEKDW